MCISSPKLDFSHLSMPIALSRDNECVMMTMLCNMSGIFSSFFLCGLLSNGLFS